MLKKERGKLMRELREKVRMSHKVYFGSDGACVCLLAGSRAAEIVSAQLRRSWRQPRIPVPKLYQRTGEPTWCVCVCEGEREKERERRVREE